MNAAERKTYPLATGLLDYFPDACMEVAHLSKVGNDQHNPGQPLHWAREKSIDHPDALMRHLKDRGTRDTDGERHSAKVAWRAMAALQVEIELERAQANNKLPYPQAGQRIGEAQLIDAGITVSHTEGAAIGGSIPRTAAFEFAKRQMTGPVERPGYSVHGIKRDTEMCPTAPNVDRSLLRPVDYTTEADRMRYAGMQDRITEDPWNDEGRQT